MVRISASQRRMVSAEASGSVISRKSRSISAISSSYSEGTWSRMVSNGVLWPKMGHTYAEALIVGEKTPHAAHILHISGMIPLDDPSAELAKNVLIGRKKAAAMLAIVAKTTCGKECQTPDTGPERSGGAIRHVVAHDGIVHGIRGRYESLWGAMGQNESRRPTTGYYDPVSPILIQRSRKRPKSPGKAPKGPL